MKFKLTHITINKTNGSLHLVQRHDEGDIEVNVSNKNAVFL